MKHPDNPAVAQAERDFDAQAMAAECAARAHRYMRDECIDALLFDPARLISTPGFKRKRMAAEDVLYESFSERDGDERLHEVARILGLVAQGATEPSLPLRASALLATIANEHAAWHVEFWEQL